MSRYQYRQVARVVARRSFAPGGVLSTEHGAELRTLIEEFADGDDAEWILEGEKSAHRLEVFKGAMEKVLLTYVARRMTPPLEPTDTSTFFRFVVRDDPTEDGEARSLRARLRLHDEMLSVLRRLDPYDFERLCGRVLSETGCEAVHVTRSSKDLGVDFFGRLPVEQLGDLEIGNSPRLRVLGGLYLFLFGQAKRYAEYNTINLDTVKLIEGTWEDLRRRRLDGTLPEDLTDGLRRTGWRAADGVRYIFVTTSTYTPPALTWATNVGMATLDGEQVAQLLLEAQIGVQEIARNEWTTSADLLTAACA